MSQPTKTFADVLSHRSRNRSRDGYGDGSAISACSRGRRVRGQWELRDDDGGVFLGDLANGSQIIGVILMVARATVVQGGGSGVSPPCLTPAAPSHHLIPNDPVCQATLMHLEGGDGARDRLVRTTRRAAQPARIRELRRMLLGTTQSLHRRL